MAPPLGCTWAAASARPKVWVGDTRSAVMGSCFGCLGRTRAEGEQLLLDEAAPSSGRDIQCTANGKRPQQSDFGHCPVPQSYVRCGPHHRTHMQFLGETDVQSLHEIWWRYREDNPGPESERQISQEDFEIMYAIAQKVVTKMVGEYGQPMVVDQVTISNTNHVGHFPHADNVALDSVWWNGHRIKRQNERYAARQGAYILWRAERTAYRSYSASVALTDPSRYGGGELRFFDNLFDEVPTETYRCEVGNGVGFCGCQRNIHSVTGVTWGFRLVFLVWARSPDVCVGEEDTRIRYFRPGTGAGVWLTTNDIVHYEAERRRRAGLPPIQMLPTEWDDHSCHCRTCVVERPKTAWKDCRGRRGTVGESRGDFHEHCPRGQAIVQCTLHTRFELQDVISAADVGALLQIRRGRCRSRWAYLSDGDYAAYREIADKVVAAMAHHVGEPLEFDHAIISCTNPAGHSRRVDNLRFDSVWWDGKPIKRRDEFEAIRGGAFVLWKESKHSYRNYSCSIALSSPTDYEGGDLQFFEAWGDREPSQTYRCAAGSGVAYCGCAANIFRVDRVSSGSRLVLLVWTRPPGISVPHDAEIQRAGGGRNVSLTSEARWAWNRWDGNLPVPPEEGDAAGTRSEGDGD